MGFFKNFLLGYDILPDYTPPVSVAHPPSKPSSSSPPISRINDQTSVKLESLKKRTSDLFQNQSDVINSYKTFNREYRLLKHDIRQNINDIQATSSSKNSKELTQRLQHTQEQLAQLKKIAKRALNHYQSHAPGSLLISSDSLVTESSRSQPRQKTAKTYARQLIFLHNLYMKQKSLSEDNGSSTKMLLEIRNQFVETLDLFESSLSEHASQKMPCFFNPLIFKKYLDVMTNGLAGESAASMPSSSSFQSVDNLSSAFREMDSLETMPQADLHHLTEIFSKINPNFSLESLQGGAIANGCIYLMHEIDSFLRDAFIPTPFVERHMEELMQQLCNHIIQSGNMPELADVFLSFKDFSPFLNDQIYADLSLALMQKGCYHLSINCLMKVQNFAVAEASWNAVVDMAVAKSDCALAEWLAKVYQSQPLSNEKLSISLLKKAAFSTLEVLNDYKHAKSLLITTPDDLVDPNRYLAMIDLLTLLMEKQGIAKAFDAAMSFTEYHTYDYWHSDTPQDLQVRFTADVLKKIANISIKNGGVNEAVEVFTLLIRRLTIDVATPHGAKEQVLKDKIMILFSLELIRLKDFVGAEKAIGQIKKTIAKETLTKELAALGEYLETGGRGSIMTSSSNFAIYSNDSLQEAMRLVVLHNSFMRVFLAPAIDRDEISPEEISASFEKSLNLHEQSINEGQVAYTSVRTDPEILRRYLAQQKNVLSHPSTLERAPQVVSSSSSSAESLTDEHLLKSPKNELFEVINQLKNIFPLDPAIEKQILETHDLEQLLQIIETFIAQAPSQSKFNEDVQGLIATLAICIENLPNIGEHAQLFLNSPIFSSCANDHVYSRLASALLRSENYHLCLNALERIQNFSLLESSWNNAIDSAIEKSDHRLAVWFAKAYQEQAFPNETLSITLLKKAACCYFKNTNNFSRSYSLLMRTNEDLVDKDRRFALLELLHLLSEKRGIINAYNAIHAHLLNKSVLSSSSKSSLDVTRKFLSDVLIEFAERTVQNGTIAQNMAHFALIDNRMPIIIATAHGAKQQFVKDEIFSLFSKELMRLSNFETGRRAIVQISNRETRIRFTSDLKKIEAKKQAADLWSI